MREPRTVVQSPLIKKIWHLALRLLVPQYLQDFLLLLVNYCFYWLNNTAIYSGVYCSSFCCILKKKQLWGTLCFILTVFGLFSYIMCCKVDVVYIDTNSGLLYMLVFYFPQWCQSVIGCTLVDTCWPAFTYRCRGRARRHGHILLWWQEVVFSGPLPLMGYRVQGENVSGLPAVSRHTWYHPAPAQNH